MTPFKAIKIIIHVISTDHQLLLEYILLLQQQNAFCKYLFKKII